MVLKANRDLFSVNCPASLQVAVLRRPEVRESG